MRLSQSTPALLEHAVPMPTSHATATVADQACHIIRNWIVAGAYPAGSLLPSQRELCIQLGVSRTSLREALSTLQGMGLVVVRPGKGMYVAQPPLRANSPNLADPLSPPAEAAPTPWRFADTCALADVYQLRFVLEGFAARLAALVIQPDDLTQLRENLAHMQQCIDADDLTRASQLDFAFHLHIATLSGNRAMADVLRASGEVIRESQRLPFYQRAARGATGTEHAAIIDALAQGHAELAQQAMGRHIVQAAQRAGVHFPAAL